MTWNNPPPIVPTIAKAGKKITPEMIAGDSESSQQKALFSWAADSVGKYPQLAYMFAIPNGGLRDVRTATNLKAEGVKAGVPDIFLPCPKMGIELIANKVKDGYNFTSYHGLFIEMKLEKYRNHKNGGCSDAQLDFMCYAASYGYYRKVCYSWEEARDVLVNYLEGKL